MFGSEFLECQNLWKSNLAVTWDQVYHSVKASSVRSVNQYSWLTSWLTLGQHSIKTWSALNQQMCSSRLHIYCNMNSPSKNQDITEQEIWTWRFCDKALHIATITFFNKCSNTIFAYGKFTSWIRNHNWNPFYFRRCIKVLNDITTLLCDSRW